MLYVACCCSCVEDECGAMIRDVMHGVCVVLERATIDPWSMLADTRLNQPTRDPSRYCGQVSPDL